MRALRERPQALAGRSAQHHLTGDVRVAEELRAAREQCLRLVILKLLAPVLGLLSVADVRDSAKVEDQVRLLAGAFDLRSE